MAYKALWCGLFIRLDIAEQQQSWPRIELFLICFYGDTTSSQWQILQRKWGAIRVDIRARPLKQPFRLFIHFNHWLDFFLLFFYPQGCSDRRHKAPQAYRCKFSWLWGYPSWTVYNWFTATIRESFIKHTLLKNSYLSYLLRGPGEPSTFDIFLNNFFLNSQICGNCAVMFLTFINVAVKPSPCRNIRTPQRKLDGALQTSP